MTDQPFATEALVQGATVRLVLRGELDDAGAAELRGAVARLHGQGIRHLICDLRGLRYLGTDGLHALAALDAEARANGHNASFVRASGTPWRALRAVGMADRLVWVDHPDELAPPS